MVHGIFNVRNDLSAYAYESETGTDESAQSIDSEELKNGLSPCRVQESNPVENFVPYLIAHVGGHEHQPQVVDDNGRLQTER